MTALSLAFLLALAGVGTPARNARPKASETPATTTTTEDLPAAEVANRVRAYLGAIDTPIPAARWRALGPRAVAPLEAVVRDPEALPSRRSKAVDALSVVGGERARELVLETARSEREPFGVRASALRGASRLLATKDLVKELRPVLEGARDPTVRATAAEVLARHAGPSSCRAVRAQAAREGGDVRGRFTPALVRCGNVAPGR
ncbi:MAG: hypothetical protein A2V77_02725 [Anaeromyxobacter sp. RBG_16_69_14]|nr:MAG: hypothetical protein A2V77_02725 [Anaeromyxobacter sp. RBG_16_69_14]